MLSKNQMKVIFTTAGVIVLVLALMLGIMNVLNRANDVRTVKKQYTDFKAVVTGLRDSSKKLESDRESYAAAKAEYEKMKAEYDKQAEEFEKTDREFGKDVLEYNQSLIQYNVGQSALSQGQQAYDSGKAQLQQGWDAYEQGKAAYDEGVKQLGAYEQGKAAYEDGVKQYEQGLDAYNKLMFLIETVEGQGVPHELALQLISMQSGTEVTDESLAQMKSGLDTAKAGLDEAKDKLDKAQEMVSQLDGAKEKLDSTYDALKQGEDGLKQAAAQLDSGRAQISSLSATINGGIERLDAQQTEVLKKKAALEAKKAKLADKKDALKPFEDTEVLTQRGRDTLIDEGYGTKDNSTADLIASAQKQVDKLHGAYAKALSSFLVSYIGYFAGIACAVVALVLMSKSKLPASLKWGIAAAALSAVGVIASIVYGQVEVLAFAGCTLTAAGAGMSIAAKSEEI